MSTLILNTSISNTSRPTIRRVAVTAPFSWLRKGWQDLLQRWPASIGLGVVFAGIGYALTHHTWAHAYLAMFFTSGFLLVAPFLALGFYAISRRIESPSETPFFTAIKGNLNSIGMYGLTLAFVLNVWERISAVMVGLFYKGDLFTGNQIGLDKLLASQNLDFLLPWMLVGGALAVLVFALSVLTLPLLMERKVDFITGMGASLRAVALNPLAMLLWAAIIAALVLIGEALWFVGLAVILPLLGHATWHAYRDLVEAG